MNIYKIFKLILSKYYIFVKYYFFIKQNMMKFIKYTTAILLFLHFSFFNNLILAQKTSETDSIKKAFEKMPEDTVKVNQLNDFVWKIKMSNFEDALIYGQESCNLAAKLNYEKGIAYATKNLGAVYYYASDYENAHKYYTISLEAFEKLNDKNGIAIALRNVGNVYSQIADWKQALDYYFKSLSIREEIGDKKGVAAVYDAIGIVYSSYKKDDYKTATNYHHKALKINLELNDQYGIATSYLYLGNNYYTKHLSDSLQSTADTAIQYLNKSREISELQNNVMYLATIDDILGQLYLKDNKFDTAYFYFNNGLKIREQLGNTFGIISSYIYISSYYSETHNFLKSKVFLENALQLAKEIDSKNQIKEIYGILAGVYYKLGDYKKSSDIYISFIQIKDSLQNEEKTKELTQLAMQHEFDKKEKERELEDKKKEVLQIEKDKRDRIVKLGLTAGVLLMIIIAFNLIRSYRRKVKANNLLKDKNQEITEKNTMLNQQKEEIQAQAENLQDAYNEIEKQHKDITDSIIYAQRIQEAVLLPDEYFENILSDHFILFKPRDIVSGDYYWAKDRGNKIIIIAADCTGHGVPGAFMSLLGISNLNEIVINLFNEVGENIQAGIILDKLRDSIKEALRQTGKDGESKDGMDMSVCIIDKKDMKMQFAGAQNPIILVRDNELIKLKPDRMPVGIHYGIEKNFTNHIIDIKNEDKIYMLSDGYVDQFGGDKSRKFMMKQFEQLISEINNKSMKEQKEIFDETIINWQNHIDINGKSFKQIDDILVIGLKI